jgi:hypothetical protein
MSKIAHSFKRLEDFVNGKDAVREGAAASLFIKNIKLHKQSNNEKVSGAEKLELLD